MTFPSWLTFPEREWETASPAAAGFDGDIFNAWVRSKMYAVGGTGAENPGDYGAVFTRGSKIVATWGNPDHYWSSASVGKIFAKLALQLTADSGRIGSISDFVRDYWVGDGRGDEGLLNHPDKYMTSAHHRSLRFVHLAGGNIPHHRMIIESSGHMGGFPVTNGKHWRDHAMVPPWANWHNGDGDRANYAQVEPGTVLRYSSGGVWRLMQALTFIWCQDLKDVIDDKIMSKIGISADRWDWLTGYYVRFNPLYRDAPEYGTFSDEPYKIKGHWVRGGGGDVVMTPEDLARVGLLLSTGGWWRGEKLVNLEPYQVTPGHIGGGGSALYGYRSSGNVDLYCSYAQVTAAGFGLVPYVNDLANMVVCDPA